MTRVAFFGVSMMIAACSEKGVVTPVSLPTPAPTSTDGGRVIPVPSYSGDFADPFIVREGAVFHAYATNTVGGQVIHVPHIASTDLIHWSTPTDAMPVSAPWAEEGMLHWAPTVLRTGTGSFVLFYADKKSGTGTPGQWGEQCIGRAVASRPEGPFVDTSTTPLICDPDGFWAIDPSIFHARNGRSYLLWRQDMAGSPSASNQIVIRELADNGTDFAPGSTRVELLRRDQAWEFPVMENPSMIEIGGKTLLFYSANAWEGAGYGIGYAECAGVFGPCTKITADAPWRGSADALAGPGGQDFFSDSEGQLWMSFHSWIRPHVGSAAGGKRSLVVARFALGPEGVPELHW